MDYISGEISRVTKITWKKQKITEITWEVNFFSGPAPSIDFYLASKSFHFSNAVWNLEIFPNGRSSAKNAGFIDLFLKRLKSNVPSHRVAARFSFKTNHGAEHGSHFFEGTVDENYARLGGESYLETRTLKKQMEFLLKNNTLTVCCEIKVKDPVSNQDKLLRSSYPLELHNASSQTEVHFQADVQATSFNVLNTLQSNYKNLLESEEDSDVCLKVSNKEFRAHKCILRSRSSVFSAMLKHDTEEKASGEVVIEDLDPESFLDFLKHVYAGSVDTLSEENVFNLYAAADKYDMADLKSECKNYMERTLSVDTFCDVVILALRHHEDDLLKLAVDFFAKNLTKIIVTVKWQKFLKIYDTAANELLIKALVPADEK